MLLQAVVSSKTFLLPIFFHLRDLAKTLDLPTIDSSEASESATLAEEQAVEQERLLLAILHQLAENTGTLSELPLAHAKQLASRVAFAALTRNDLKTFDTISQDSGLVSLLCSWMLPNTNYLSL